MADAPEDSTDNIGHRVDQEMIGAKYYQDETTRTALQAAQITVQAAMSPDGQIIAMYSNSRMSSEVHAAIKKKQEEASPRERRRAPRENPRIRSRRPALSLPA